jgi:hypothetical protein
VHVGKAAALIVAAVLVGVIVLRDDSSASVSSDALREAADRVAVTSTTLPRTSTTSTSAAAAHTPEQVKVVAINATGTSGQAAKATTKLHNAGYNALQPADAAASVKAAHPASVVYVVTPGYEKDASDIVALFGLPDSAIHAGLPSPPPSSTIQAGVNIVVLVGTGITL